MSEADFKSQIEKIRDASDVVDIIGSYITLNRKGPHYEALCPFHKEKTPSFKVNPNRQSFYCFGCHTGGDVFSFVQKYEGVDFLHAARVLAQRAGLRIELTPGVSDHDAREKDKLLSVSQAVAGYYRNALLKSPQAQPARDYLNQRHLTPALELFQIGYSPLQSDDMIRWARGADIALELLEMAGVMARGEKGDWYDRFRGRLMFPVLDDIGQVLGFSGRLLPGDPRENRTGKYVNSPETPLFRKSRILYGMHLAKKPMLDRRSAILCEGQIDVIRCHLAGFSHAVAAQGTAITEDHARILRRSADDITLVLDGDTAGSEAGLRSIPIFIQAGLVSHVVTMPPGSDPDSFLQEQGAEALATLLTEAEPGMAFLCRIHLERNRDMPRETAVIRAAKEVIAAASKAPSSVFQEHLLTQAAAALGLTRDALRRDVIHAQSRDQQRQAHRAPEEAPATPSARIPPSEMQLLELMVHFPHCVDEAAPFLQPEHFHHPACADLYRKFLQHPGDEDWDLVRECIEEPDPVKTLAVRLITEEHHLFDTEEVQPHEIAQDLILSIRLKDMESHLRRLQDRRKQAEGQEKAKLTEACLVLRSDVETVRQGWEKARPILELHDEL
ncbi:MAG: DNA primase [Kiritimatiellae bacterium]|nr:DNA primase [Kiritimatiellia bacterium]